MTQNPTTPFITQAIRGNAPFWKVVVYIGLCVNYLLFAAGGYLVWLFSDYNAATVAANSILAAFGFNLLYLLLLYRNRQNRTSQTITLFAAILWTVFPLWLVWLPIVHSAIKG